MKIQYLIKFIPQKFLDVLLEKGLYMNAAAHYALMENNESRQADKYEGIARTDCLVYKNCDRPIWCCTAIKNDLVENGVIKLDKRLFDDFFYGNLTDGRIVVFKYETFLKSFIEHKDKYRSAFGCVNYIPYHSFQDCFISKNWSDTIFRKDINYAYQTEFRIAIDRVCEKIFMQEEIDGQIYNILKDYKPYFFPLPNLLKSSKVYKASELKLFDNFYLLEIKD